MLISTTNYKIIFATFLFKTPAWHFANYTTQTTKSAPYRTVKQKKDERLCGCVQVDSSSQENDVLYNKETHGYSDLNGKELVWEDIHKNLFPGYEDFDDETKSTIRKTVRKRWKSLRDCVVKDLKMRTENPSYIRRKHNPLVDELQFILPYVKKH
uniref:MADF domain-containing protein n=1 Tax=Megaselia scalaris TaxID=36166 RepID=T1GTU7_MEGSC